MRTAAVQSRLQRLLTAFRDRDWAAIFIELLVVTLGVLLAFQIDQWGQDRRQAKQERQFLERMWRETSEAMRENDWVIGIHARIQLGIVRGLNGNGSAQTPDSQPRKPEWGCGADSMIGLGFNDTSYHELSASGGLNIVSDPDLRAELRDVAAAQADAVAQLNWSRQNSIPIRRALDPYYFMDLDRDGNRTCTVNWGALQKDPIARSAVARASRNHVLMWWKRAYTRDVLATAHNRIACKLGKSDCLKQVPQIVGRRNYSDTVPPELLHKFDETAARNITL
jgi:hypothetical protein